MRALFMLLTIVAIAAIPAAAQQSSPKTEKPAAVAKAGKPAPSVALVNLNTATQAQLETLPGVGAKAAERILEYRQKNGQFKKIEEQLVVGAIYVVRARRGARSRWATRVQGVSSSRRSCCVSRSTWLATATGRGSISSSWMQAARSLSAGRAATRFGRVAIRTRRLERPPPEVHQAPHEYRLNGSLRAAGPRRGSELFRGVT